MTRYLISFDDGWMTFPEEELPDVAKAATDVVREAQDAGVWVYGAGLDEPVAMDSDADGDGRVTGPADRRLYYHQNARDSVFALTDATGKAVEGYQYDPYGRPTVYEPGPNGRLDWGGDDRLVPGGASALGNPYLYAGRRFEPETGLYHYRSRYLDPAQGRFISQDPLGPWGARGMAEMPFMPLAPAVVAALHDATGVWFDEIPLLPWRVVEGLKEQNL